MTTENAHQHLLLDLLDLLGLQDVLWKHGMKIALIAAQKKLLKMQSDTDCMGELLAVIHGDGGHYMIEHGMEKACKDAEKVVTDLRMDVAAWRESHDILVHSEDPW